MTPLRTATFAVLLLVLSQPASGRAFRRTAIDPAVVNDPRAISPAGPGSRGSSVLRAQILLDRAHFSAGEIDGSYGSNMERAVRAYQRAWGIPSTGFVDQRTWQLLNRDRDVALATYRLTAADAAGPYVNIPMRMASKARLAFLGYESPLEMLGERFHCSPDLLRRLNRGKTFRSAGEAILVPDVRDDTPGKADYVVVRRSDLSLTAYDAENRILARYPATIGSSHDPLPVGTWKINGTAKMPKYHYNPKLFWDADEGEAKAVIPPGPNNPVGVAWIDLSKEHYGIHGTPEPSAIGKSYSHGCIRLANWDVWQLARMVSPGVRAVLEQ